ncbi:MAG TPA: nucleotide-binding protein [Candidatus Thermoplasmatota archaeon]|nr:nucleotide-binding protein [Candidatus Thermoplasmatota archaeon]
MARPLVLDTSALLAGRPLGPGEATLIPSAVLEELRPGGRDRRHLDMLVAAGARVVEAAPADRARVVEAGKAGGDGSRLSAADIDVLAVALEVDGEIVTDDYTVLNLARRLSIPARTIQTKGITQTYRFVPRCMGCGRFLDKEYPDCPVCGSPVKMVKDRGAPR